MSSLAFTPDAAAFAEGFAARTGQIVSTTLIADLETPVSAMLKLQRKGEPCFLLESVQGGEARGRYSIIGLLPDMIWRCRGTQAEINHKGSLADKDFTPVKEDSLTSLKTLVRDCRIAFPEHLPPMAAGLIGYMGYDMVKLMETLPDKNPDSINIPDACFMRPRLMLVFDSVKGVLHICAPLWKEHGYASAKEAHEKLTTLIASVASRLKKPLPASAASGRPHRLRLPRTPRARNIMQWSSARRNTLPPATYFRSCRRSVSRRRSPCRRLRYTVRCATPTRRRFYSSSISAAACWWDRAPRSSCGCATSEVTIRPLAGTRKRGATAAEDEALAKDLLADPKEIAEHLMLLDLGRNDIGRIAKVGTVKVTERMVVERYSHVMHIVSNVEGTLDKRYDAIDALFAGFPAGTVSGAPKIRAMEIIDEIEKERRSFYAGCVGYFSAGGSMDTCITLRTGLVKDGMLYLQAGGGVVSDSDPEGEYQESNNKARALMRAAEDAGKFV